MQFRINEIGLFRENKKDIVKFKNDINFISGESNTGKSSIGEIIDYCLASSKSTIAKGNKINLTDIFAINIEVNNTNIVIARNNYNRTEKKGKKYIFLKKVDKDFSFNSIDISWFEKNDLNYMNLENFKEIEIVKYCPSFPPKTRLNGKEKVRPTIRSMIPFMLQTQDIIKNKNHLFYQMDKPNKIKQIKRDFELFLGIIDYSIYEKTNRKNELIKEIKNIKNKNDLYEKELEREYENLKSHYYRLFSHLNKDININEIEKETLKDLNYLNTFKVTYTPDSDIGRRIDDLETKVNQQSRILENIKIEYSNVKNQIRHIETTQNELNQVLNTVSNKYHNICPLCESKIDKKFEIFIKAKEKIKNDQNFLKTYNINILYEKEKELKSKLNEEKKKFFSINTQLNILKKDFKEIKDLENKKNLLAELKGMIKQTIKKINEYEEKISNQENLKSLEDELKKVEKELKKIDLKKKKFEAEYLIGQYATEVLIKLPFDENDYGKPNLKFDIKEMKMYQENKSQLYYLSDLGSAENHLSFHLATFLGLHKYILEHQNSILPSFIFLDQPSQVYFPPEKEDFKNKNEEIKKVENIYQQIINFINQCNSLNNLPKIQIIIVDHFYSEKDWYQKYLIEPRWEKNKGLGLIKEKDNNA